MNASTSSFYSPKIRIIASHEWNTYREIRLRALKDSPDAFGGTLEQEQNRSNEDWARRLTENTDLNMDLPLFAEVNGSPVGLVWGHIDHDSPFKAGLYQMWVAPEYRGHGIGQMLVEAVISWARQVNVDFLELGVTWGDSPARRLYERVGFIPSGPPKLLRPSSKLRYQPMRLDLNEK